MKMREIAEEIYEVILHDKEKEVGEMRVHIVKGKPGKRSLMVDTGFGSQESLEDMEEALAALDISYKDLDIFLTHKHHDHCGLAIRDLLAEKVSFKQFEETRQSKTRIGTQRR